METEEEVFRVRVSLERFFSDTRARCYMGATRARPVRWLARRLRRAFPLPRALALVCRGHLLPPAEPLALLQPDDLLEVIPVDPSEQVHCRKKVPKDNVNILSENIVSPHHIEENPVDENDGPAIELNESLETWEMSVSSECNEASVEPRATRVKNTASAEKGPASDTMSMDATAGLVAPSSPVRGELDAPSSPVRGELDAPSSPVRGELDAPSSPVRGELDAPSSPARVELEAGKLHALHLLQQLAGERLVQRRRRVRRRRRAPTLRARCLEAPAADSVEPDPVLAVVSPGAAGVVRAGSEQRAPRLVHALPTHLPVAS